jgi:enoyl-CoA hydratase
MPGEGEDPMEFVSVEISDAIATVTLERPPVNALDARAFRELTMAFTALGRGRAATGCSAPGSI